MMFEEARELINRPPKLFFGKEYDGTHVGSILEKIQKYNGPGDAYRVEYRVLLDGGNVVTGVGIANYSWIAKVGYRPDVEITRIKPTEATLDRWSCIYSEKWHD